MNYESRIEAAIKGITEDTGEFFHGETIMKSIASTQIYPGDRASHEKPGLSFAGLLGAIVVVVGVFGPAGIS